jgi:nitroreductase/dihydropteridine reductase
LKSVVIMTLGYRDVENDPYVKAKKVRRPNEEFFINV